MAATPSLDVGTEAFRRAPDRERVRLRLVRPSSSDVLVDGRYRLLHRVGSGATAVVYCAHDLQLGRKVALKVLHHHCAEDREIVARFRREACTAARLRHPHVVWVYDRGTRDGTHYIAMEYVPGGSLKSIIDREAPLESGRAIDLTVQLLPAARRGGTGALG